MRHWQIQWKVEPWKGLYWCCSDGSLRERIIGRFNRSIGKWLTIELWNLSLKFLWSQPRLNIMGVAVTISWFFFLCVVPYTTFMTWCLWSSDIGFHQLSNSKKGDRPWKWTTDEISGKNAFGVLNFGEPVVEH